jgi:antimicrobial peptide system SdpA family protein
MRVIVNYLIPATIVIGFYSFAFLAAWELNPISFSAQSAKIIYTLLPEGWGFFTRSPRENQIKVYRSAQGRYVLINKSNAEPEYLFGLSRVSRRINIELGQVFTQIADSSWTDCKSSEFTDCSGVNRVQVTNRFDEPLCRGEYTLISAPPIPWAWSRAYNKIRMPYSIIIVDVH